MAKVGDRLVNEDLNQQASVIAVEELNGVLNVSLQPETGGRIVLAESDLESNGWKSVPDTEATAIEASEPDSIEGEPLE